MQGFSTKNLGLLHTAELHPQVDSLQHAGHLYHKSINSWWEVWCVNPLPLPPQVTRWLTWSPAGEFIHLH